MTPDAWLAGGTVVAVFVLLALSRWPAYIVLLAGLTLLLGAGVVSPAAALSGFSNPGLATVAILFIVAAGLRQTGTLAYLVRRALGRPRTVRLAQARMAGPVVLGSAFLNNTPLVSMLLPVITDWCRIARVPASKVLLPLSYFAILGGITTLVGTSTNLVVDGLLIQRGEPSMGMFGITAVGLPGALLGVAYLLAFGNRLLPDRRTLVEDAETPREYTLEVSVRAGGPLDGKLAEITGLLHVPGLSWVELRRPDGEVVEEPGLRQRLEAGDVLVFSGVLDAILDVLRTPGLAAAQAQLDKLDGHAADRCYVEAVVSRTSPLLARTVKEVRFFELYHAVVLAVARNGQRLRAPLDELDFRPGDALFLEAPRDFVDKRRNSGDFALASRIEGEGPATSAQAPLAALILLSMVVVVAFGWLPMLTAAALAAAAMLITRCCSEETARSSIDWPLVLAIGAAFGLGRALEDTGVAVVVSGALLRGAGDDPLLALAVVYGTTCLLTEFVTNNAAAVIVFPIAYGTAEQLGVNHVPFVAAVMIAASASFVTPIGYQTNLMVYGPGGYRFSDFARVGLPLALLLGAMTVALAPLVYGF